jgi:endonuclease/exonuclease/phosphatase family metal-dependent hydrolase
VSGRAGDFRIATFNLENLGGTEPDGGAEIDRRIAALRPLLDALDADVLCLQEINGQRPADGGPRRLLALDRLLADSRYAGFHRAASGSVHPEHGAADRHNLAILSRWPLHDVRQIRHETVPPVAYRPVTADPPPDGAQPLTWDRPILAARADPPDGAPLHLVNLHLRAPLAAYVPGQKDGGRWRSVPGWAEGFFVAAVKRVQQAMAARLEVDRLLDADPRARICVAGDCNAEVREMPLRVLRADPDDVEAPGLAWRSLSALDDRVPHARRYTLLHGGRRLMLDHLLASRALAATCRDVAVHNDGLLDEVAAAQADKPPLQSFHAPVVAAFTPGERPG